MKLRIKVQDGLPIGHPAYEDNLIDAYKEIPPEWEPFVRVENPTLGKNNLLLLHPTPIYRKINGVWQDYWYYREKTPEEMEEFYRPFKEAWARRPYAENFKAWVFDEQSLRFEPPFPRPQDGKFYRWSGPDNNWKEAPVPPDDGKLYDFDFDNWVNVEVPRNV